MHKPQLIALDMDGTLLHAHNSWLSPGHHHCIKEIQRQGISIALITGRPLLTTVGTWHSLKLTSPIVCFNGTWVGHADGSCIAKNALSEKDVQDILNCLKSCPQATGSINAYPNMRTWLMNGITETTEDWAKIYNTDIQYNAEAFENWQGESQKILYAGPVPSLPGIMQHVRRCFGSRFHIVKSQEDRFEIHQHASKAWGLSVLAQHLNIEQSAVWAVGDADNDKEMLRWAGRSFAMGNAAPSVCEDADHILPSVSARGLCALLPYIQDMTH